jgi:hypothetical protein
MSHRPLRPPGDVATLDTTEFVRQLKAQQQQGSREFDYRRAALAILPHVCARCGKEYEGKNLPVLTVHHRDGNHQNNPRDGSNWELLCVYCHENEHARLAVADGTAAEAPRAAPTSGARMVSLADKLASALKGGKP